MKGKVLLSNSVKAVMGRVLLVPLFDGNSQSEKKSWLNLLPQSINWVFARVCKYELESDTCPSQVPKARRELICKLRKPNF